MDDRSAHDDSPFGKFQRAVKQVLSAPKDEVEEQLKQEQEQRAAAKKK